MPPTEPRPRAFRDVARVYLAVVGVIVVAAALAEVVSIVGQLLYAIVALLFFLVPERIIESRGEDPRDYALWRGDVKTGVLWGLGATLLTIPFFVPGYWIWEKYGLGRNFEPDAGRYRQWSADLDSEPKDWGKAGPGAWVWSDRDELSVGLRNDGGPNNRVVIDADVPFKPDKRGPIVLKPLAAGPDGASSRWHATLTHSRGRGVVMIRGPDEIDVRTEPIVDTNPRWSLYAGANERVVEGGRLHDNRAYWWLVLWFATQLLLVAIPEEVFYRGFIQTRLEHGFAARGTETVILGFTPAIVVTSLLFGIGHVVVPVGGAFIASRMAVFFPSLLFGWLRRRTGSVLAPAIYHAFSNAMVLLAAVHFV